MTYLFGECTKKEAQQAKGFDWAKIVKVQEGWAFFETIQEYETWKRQK